MPRRGDVFAKGRYYHVFNRGVNRAPLFFSPDNYAHCLRLVKRYRDRYAVAVIAYCLMPTHYHFVLRQDADSPLSRFVGAVFNAYVQVVNRQERRSGALFEGRFRHVWVDREEYVVHLCRYVHLNPVAAGLVAYPWEWPYSNYLEWVGRRGGTLVDEAFITARFDDAENYERYVLGWTGEARVRGRLKRYLME
ncbi:MAG: transposase [Planctomycetota bacterium]